MKEITFQSVFDTLSVKMGSLNSIGQTPDGRVWEYLKATEAVSQYMVVSNPANTDVDTVSSSTNARSQIVYITEASAGWTAGDYQDHWVIVDDGTGEGQLGKIKDNTTDTLEPTIPSLTYLKSNLKPNLGNSKDLISSPISKSNLMVVL